MQLRHSTEHEDHFRNGFFELDIVFGVALFGFVSFSLLQAFLELSHQIERADKHLNQLIEAENQLERYRAGAIATEVAVSAYSSQLNETSVQVGLQHSISMLVPKH